MGGGRGAMVSVEEEAVAVSLGCHLLACFESPATSLASPQFDAFTYDLGQIHLYNICPYKVTNHPDYPLFTATEWRISVSPSFSSTHTLEKHIQMCR